MTNNSTEIDERMSETICKDGQKIRSFIRQHSGRRLSECFCYDSDRLVGKGGNVLDIQLACNCPAHYDCLVQYILTKISDRASIDRTNGIACPWGKQCMQNSNGTLNSRSCENYFLQLKDLDAIVEYGQIYAQFIKNPLTSSSVDKLKDWWRQEEAKFVDIVDDFIVETTKFCPKCKFRATHYHGHACHHISPYGGGCPNCNIEYCYKCLSTADDNLSLRSSKSACLCGRWSTFCEPFNSIDDVTHYLQIDPYPKDIRCGCVICPDCRYMKPCGDCGGNCMVCLGVLNPAPSQLYTTWTAQPEGFRFSDKRSKQFYNYSAYFREACIAGQMELAVQVFYDSGERLDVNATDNIGRSALDYATDVGHLSLIRWLVLTRLANVNQRDRDGFLPLHRSCEYGHVEVTRFFILETSTLIDAVDKYNETPFYKACRNGHVDIARLLFEYKSASIDPNIRNRDGFAPLHWVVQDDNVDLMTVLTSFRSIDVNIRNREGSVPLHWAAQDRKDIMVQILALERCCDVDVVNDEERSALHYACLNGSIEITTMLAIERNCNVDQQDDGGFAPIHYACSFGYHDIVRLLAGVRNCRINLHNFNGHSPLHLACRNGYADIVHILLQHGADVDSRCNEDLTPLYSACFYGHTEVARQLLLHNASVNCRNKRNGYTPLLLAARNNHHDLLKVLLADNVDGSSSQIDGRSALHWTCYHGNIEITKLLMTRGLCCPNARDSIGNTPLHYACQRGMSTVVYYMIQTGSVNVEIKNNDGKLPRDLAVQSDNLELMMFLV